jgi:hypothetical protein
MVLWADFTSLLINQKDFLVLILLARIDAMMRRGLRWLARRDAAVPFVVCSEPWSRDVRAKLLGFYWTASKILY